MTIHFLSGSPDLVLRVSRAAAVFFSGADQAPAAPSFPETPYQLRYLPISPLDLGHPLVCAAELLFAAVIFPVRSTAACRRLAAVLD